MKPIVITLGCNVTSVEILSLIKAAPATLVTQIKIGLMKSVDKIPTTNDAPI